MATAGTPQQIVFDGSEDKYDLWETRFLSRLHILKLKETILQVPTGEAALAESFYETGTIWTFFC